MTVARDQLIGQGVEFVTDVEAAPGGETWAYFLGAGNRLYSLQNQGN